MAIVQSWPPQVLEGLVGRVIGGKTIQTYRDLPGSIYESLRVNARRSPDAVALYADDGVPCTYEHLLAQTDALAGYLQEEMRVRENDRIAVMLDTGIEFCAAYFALNSIGAVAVILPTKFKSPDIRSLARKAEIFGAVCEERFKSWFSQGIVDESALLSPRGRTAGYGFAGLCAAGSPAVRTTRPENVAAIMFTSGTTSQSKGVLLKNYNLMHAAELYRRVMGITRRDRSVIATPIYSITGLSGLLGLFIHSGASLCLHERFDAHRLLDCLCTRGVTFLHTSPVVLRKLLEIRDTREAPPDLRTIACGGSNVPRTTITQVREWLPRVRLRPVYGMTETSSPAAIFPGGAADSPYAASNGIAVPGVDVRILDEGGRSLPVGLAGEVSLRGACVAEAYIGAAGAQRIDGWLATGDIGYVNDHGYLFIVDRKKDMINRGGEKVWCADVENVLYGVPGVLEAVVVGLPDSVYGEAPAAALRVHAGGATAEGIRLHLAERMPGYQIPVRIAFVDQIPLTAAGKVDKAAVRSLLIRQREEDQEC